MTATSSQANPSTLPQATDDTYNLSTGYLVVSEDAESSIVTTTAKLLANDKGGNGKSFYSLGDVSVGNAHTPTVASSWTISAHGALVEVDKAGNILYEPGNYWDPLAAGQVCTDTFDYTIQMGNKGALSIGKVTVLIYGVNDAAFIDGDHTGAVIEDDAAHKTVSGQLTVTDIDGLGLMVPVFSFLPAKGSYGTATITADGHWTYTLNNNLAAVQALGDGQTLTDHVTFYAADLTAKVVDITVIGANDAAIISGKTTGTVTEDGVQTAAGVLTATDVDSAPTFQVRDTNNPLTGLNHYGTATITSDGHWVYTLDNSSPQVQALAGGQTVTDQFTVQTADGTPQTITISVNGTNDPAVITGDTLGEVKEDSLDPNHPADAFPAARGTLQSTDVDGPANSFVAASGISTVNGYGTASVDAHGNWIYVLTTDQSDTIQKLNFGQHLTDSFTVATTDGVTQQVTITIDGANDLHYMSFENLADGSVLPTVYGGFDWSGLPGAIHAGSVFPSSTAPGYADPGSHWATIGAGTLTVTRDGGGAFSFYDMFMSASSSQTVSVQGFSHGVLVGSSLPTTVDAAGEKVAANWHDQIDTLVIKTTGVVNFDLFDYDYR